MNGLRWPARHLVLGVLADINHFTITNKFKKWFCSAQVIRKMTFCDRCSASQNGFPYGGFSLDDVSVRALPDRYFFSGPIFARWRFWQLIGASQNGCFQDHFSQDSNFYSWLALHKTVSLWAIFAVFSSLERIKRISMHSNGEMLFTRLCFHKTAISGASWHSG